MKFKKSLSLLLSAVMVAGCATVAVTAAESDSESVGYSNQSFLETEAGQAKNTNDFGAKYSTASTTWKTWSPKADSVKVKLYHTGSDNEAGAGAIGEYDMTKDSAGIWSVTLQGDYKDVYYTYLVNVNGAVNETQDIYSQAVGVNGNRSMVVDLDSTDPDGWDTDHHVFQSSPTASVVWEAHVRDFSIAANSGVSEENKGRYLAFTEGGTTLNGQAGAMSTCVDYLVENGINTVQLQPIYDFGSVNETIASSSTNRNWGYDPVNYNVPEGSYSSNPYDGNVRIKEFKQLVQALHDRGIRLGLSLTPYLSDFAPEFPECIDNGFFICDDSNEPILTDFDKGIMGIIDVTNQSARNWLGLRFDALLHTGVDMAEADFRYELFNDLNKDTAFYNSFAAIFNTLVKDCVARCIGSDNDSVIRSSTAAGDQIGPYRNIYMNKNTASYSSLACAITNTLSYGMTGYGITNMDVPAITTSSPTLYTRWVQVAMTMPHFRLPVPFCKDQDMLPAIKMAGNIRLALLSYLESNCVESDNYGSPVVRPMQVEFPGDRLAQKCTGQYMLGSIVMVCPVLSGAGNVTFYVPAGTWTNFLTRETVTGPRIMSRKADINEIPLYIRPNSILPSRSGDSITFSCFQLAEDKVAATEVFGFDKSANGIINVLKSGERITVKTEGFGRLTKRIVLTGIKDVAGVSEGYPDSDEYGTTIEFNSNELIITLG